MTERTKTLIAIPQRGSAPISNPMVTPTTAIAMIEKRVTASRRASDQAAMIPKRGIEVAHKFSRVPVSICARRLNAIPQTASTKLQ
ncbi:MAG: hypothetical protein DDT30_01896 [Dehalococcoidia bacterium]|nr:hypothetical protein [Bacillota bacterium]MBT9142696.1 hypothetical protein [Bacillota bacterium]